MATPKSAGVRRRLAVPKLVIGLAFPLAILVLWQVLAVLEVIDDRLFPTPTTVIDKAVSLLMSGSLPRNVAATLRRILIGYAWGASIGVSVGLVLGRMPIVRAAVGPTIAAIYTIPMLAILPLILIIFGIGDVSRVLVISIVTFLVTSIGTTEAARNVNRSYIEAGRAFGARGFRMFAEVILPGSLTSALATLRLALGISILVAISTEFLVSNDGLGYMIWNSWSVLDTKTMYAGLLVAGLLGAAASGSFALLERWFFKWTTFERSRA